MAIIQDLQSNGFTVVGNKMVRDKELSLAAKGLLLLCLSLPDNWVYSIAGLATMCKESRSTVGIYMRELERAGYVIRSQDRNDKKSRFGNCSYTIVNTASIYVAADERDLKTKKPYVSPENVLSETLSPEPLSSEILSSEILLPQNEALLNTYISSKELLNTDKPSTYQVKGSETYSLKEENNSNQKTGDTDMVLPVRQRYGKYANVLLSDTEYSTLMHEFPSDYKERIENLSEYMASTGRLYESHLATIQSWNRLDKKRGKKPDYRPGYSHSKYENKGDSL